MNRAATLTLRALLVPLLAQVLIPVLATDTGRDHPELAHAVVPYAVAAIIFVACGEVALIALWRLLAMVGRDQIFSPRAFRWVDLIIWCIAAATVLTALVTLHGMFVTKVGGFLWFYLTISTMVGLALALLMIVMRSLLRSAVADRDELVAVI